MPAANAPPKKMAPVPATAVIISCSLEDVDPNNYPKLEGFAKSIVLRTHKNGFEIWIFYPIYAGLINFTGLAFAFFLCRFASYS